MAFVCVVHVFFCHCEYDQLLTVVSTVVAMCLNSNQAFDGRWSGIGASAIGASATTGV